ncbi:MAG TPA: BTAD domain-containing putative transcriptional regulator [Kribbellaceae bacterium]
MEFRILGDLAIGSVDRPLRLGPPKQRIFTALLVARAGQVVPLRDLVDELWSEQPPKSALANLRTYAARFRASLPEAERHRLAVHPEGYRLVAGDGEVDVTEFEQEAESGRRALSRGRHSEAVRHLDRALHLWRGAFAQDVRTGVHLTARRVAVSALKMSAEEDRCEALLRLSEPTRVVGLLREQLLRNPLRERSWALLMRGLYASGDVDGALRAFADARSALVDELGIDPGAELQELHRAVLRRDPALGRPGRTDVPAQVPRQLPAAPPLTGRGRELERLASWLDDTSPTGATAVAGVYGPAGTGKTSLVLRVAHRLAHRFPDGQLYADLRGARDGGRLSSLDALTRLLSGLGVPAGEMPADVGSAAARYRSLLAERRMLVVLDQAASAAQVRPLVPVSSGSAVLLTSRRMLSTLDGARHLRLGVLPRTDSVSLLAELVGRERVQAEPEAAHRLARLCEHLPIALRIAAARVLEHPNWRIRDFVLRITDRTRRLDELEVGDLTVRGCLRGMYDELVDCGCEVDGLAARLFRALGQAHIDETGPAEAATLTGFTIEQVGRALDRLAEVQLVYPAGPARYRIPELLRLLGAELASEAIPATKADAVRDPVAW